MSIETTDLNGGIGVLFVGQGILTNQEYVDIYELIPRIPLLAILILSNTYLID